MREEDLFEKMEQIKRLLGVRSKKFSGALAVEILSRAFRQRRIRVSRPNVYIRGLTNEIDLVVPGKGSKPEFGILYQPEDVLAVLEIKTLGLFGKEESSRIASMFRAVQSIKPAIFCAYVTMSERKSYSYKATEESLGFPVYTIAWHHETVYGLRYESTGDLMRLLDRLTSISQQPIDTGAS
jgi:hypothetical protein